MTGQVQVSKKGWIVTKYSKPINTPDVTKHSLLVGYDMMPLRGLRKAEKDLRTLPYNIRRVVIKYDEKSRIYAAVIDGQISLKLAAFSNCHDSIERTKMSTAFAISGDTKRYGLSSTSKEEYSTLSLFFYIRRDAKNVLLPRDKRQKKRLVYLRLETERIFERLKVVIVPVKYVLL